LLVPGVKVQTHGTLVVFPQNQNKYLEFEYKLAPDSYMVDFNINTYNLNDVIASNTNFLTLYWGVFEVFVFIHVGPHREYLFCPLGI